MKIASLLLLALGVYAAAIAETSLAPAIEIRHVTPDLFALVAIVWQLKAGRSRGFVVAAAAGLAYDLTAAGPLGIGLGLFALTGYCIARLRSSMDLDHIAVQLAVVGLATTSIALGEATIWRLAGETSLPWATLAVRAATVGAYTAAVSVPLLLTLGWVRRAPALLLEG